jgi:hypothetical protein
VLILTWVIPARASAQQSATATAPALVFDGVTVVDVEQGKLVPAQRVVITGNRIETVGNAGTVKAPKGAQVVAASGKYLIPGLWDLHVHPRRKAHVFYPLFIANGVTGIRDASSEVPLDSLVQWRREIWAGTRVGPPRQLLSGQSINGPRNGCVRGETFPTCFSDSADARHLVDSLVAAGADMIKTYTVAKPEYFIIAHEARRLGVPFGGHVEVKGLTAAEAADSGAAILDHMNAGMLHRRCFAVEVTEQVVQEQCPPLAERLARQGTWYVFTLLRSTNGWRQNGRVGPIYARLLDRAKAFWAGSMLRGNWLRDSSAASDLGRYGCGSAGHADHAAGFHAARGIGHVRRGGDDAAEYVADGHAEPRQDASRHGDSLGTVAPGKLADLVLLDADPLADITNLTMIRAVVANGRYFDRTALDNLLAEEARTKLKPRTKQKP